MLEHELVTEVGAVVVVGELRLPPPHAVDDRNPEAEIGRPQVTFVLGIESHERGAFDLHLEALRMEDWVGSVTDDRGPPPERRIPQPSLLPGRGVGRGRRVVIIDSAEAGLLRTGEVAGVDEVVGHQLPEPRARRPQIVEALRKRGSGNQIAILRSRGKGLVGHVEDHRTGRSHRREWIDPGEQR